MKVVLSWLRELCPTDLSAEELAELLTSKGAEVEAIERPWERVSGVVVARVIEVRDHPNSDTLCLARVQTGSGELEVVVGVRNMAPGDLVPLRAARRERGRRSPNRSGPARSAAWSRTACSAPPTSSGSRRRTTGSSCSRTTSSRGRTW